MSPSGVANDPLLGREVGKYRLVERIGDGAYGEVYRVEHTRLGVSYAAKILHPSFHMQEKALKRFWREAQTTSRLKHENIVSVVDFDVDPQVGPYLVMELLEGETLGHVLREKGALPLLRVRFVAKPICMALQAAHEAGVIHRDLKPDNIFLVSRSNQETVKVLDFGVARLTEGGSEALTGVGQTLGTPEYMSPEQCRGMALTPQSDVYCFGVLLFQMLTGHLPFDGTEPHQHMVNHLMTPPPELDASFSEPLRKLMLSLLAKTPEERPQGMADVWRQLTRCLPRQTNPTFPDEEGFAIRESDLPPPAETVPVPSPSGEVILLTNKKVVAFPTLEMEAADPDYEESATQVELDALGHREASERLEQTMEIIEEPRHLHPGLVESALSMSTLLTIQVESTEVFCLEYLKGIDEGGMFLSTQTPLVDGETFFFRFALPNGDALVEGWGEVSRMVLPGEGTSSGMYVRFVRLTPSARQTVSSLLR